MRAPSTLAITLIFMSGADAQQAATSALFGDWSVNCDPYLACESTTRIGQHPSSQFLPNYRLVISRRAYETHWEVMFETFATQPNEQTSFEIAVDGIAQSFLEGEEIALFDRMNTYYPLGSKAQTLMDRMVPGSAMSISFKDEKAQPVQVSFSLSGLAAAMLWIDEKQARLGSERVTGVAPENKMQATTRAVTPPSAALIALHTASGECDDQTALSYNEPISYRLTTTQMLHLLPCWAGAYNYGYRAYVEDNNHARPIYFATYSDRLGWTGTPDIVNPWFEEFTNILGAFYKGRGLGDCGTLGLWRWDEWGFKLLEFSAKDICNSPDEPGDFPTVYRAPDYLPPMVE